MLAEDKTGERESNVPRREVEDRMRRHTHPFTKVAGIGERDATCHDSRLDLCLSRGVSSPGYYDFICWPNLTTDKLDFIGNKKSYVLDVLALSPTARQHIPLRRRADDDVTLFEQAKVGAGLPGQALDDLPILQLPKLLPPLSSSLVDHLLVRLDANSPRSVSLAPQSQKGKFSADGLPTTSWSANEDVLVCRVESLENLSLDLVEGFDRRGVDLFKLLVVECRQRKGLEIEERSGSREFLREDEVFEGYREASL